MLNIYKSDRQGVLREYDEIKRESWVNMVDPTEEEIKFVSTSLGLGEDFIRPLLDDEERSRIELDKDEKGLIIVDTPIIIKDENSITVDTFPIGIIHTKDCVVTISLKEDTILKKFINNKVRTFFTYKKSRFILQILYYNTSEYLHYLRFIDKQSEKIETELRMTMKNQDLMKLLDLEKSLVYISTSLKSNELVLEKLVRLGFINKYQEDSELIEDIIVENKQGIEMARIYTQILSETRDAISSVMNNNMNSVMKLLAIVTIIMAIPTVITGFFGMNVLIPTLFSGHYAFYIIVLMTIIICIMGFLLMKKKRL